MPTIITLPPKAFFLGAIIWYLMLNSLFCAVCGVLGEDRPTKYSTVDNLVFASLCFGWVIA